LFQVDLLLPVEPGSALNHGALQMSISIPSHRLSNIVIGKMSFQSLRLGVFNTLRFPIPDQARAALGPALAQTSPSEVVFQFELDVSTSIHGTFIFDNLRVHSTVLPTGHGTSRPAGYGNSVDLVAEGAIPAAENLEAGSVQVPEGFHLNQGVAGQTSV